ncbi:Uncharacterised protein [Neisseria zoodegmatis]|uniref:Lipoprotein n=1 Tax=Neisseria zoodegmatis TaxID=326523 RepID=A0A378WRF1_9NEIS|nr:hypothetical protein [Neisseria zoodegmatis]SUA43828.1 Uncharacterised protein [Neisseria zoodegmatis]
MKVFKVFNLFYLFLSLFYVSACSPNEIDKSYPNQKIENPKPKSEHSKFSLNGVGNIHIEDTFNKKSFVQTDEEIEGCFYAENKEYPSFSFKFIDNKLVEIESHSKGQVTSPYGIKIGDVPELIYQKHKGEKEEIMNHPYGDENDKVIFYWYKVSGADLGIKYVIVNNKVESISVGKKEELPYMEGCV